MHELANADIRKAASSSRAPLSRRAKCGTACTLRGSSSPQKAGFLGSPIAGVSLWELADELHISEPTLTRMLRHELSDVEKSDMLCSIGDVVDRHRAMGCFPI